jgi:hypothetical protein
LTAAASFRLGKVRVKVDSGQPYTGRAACAAAGAQAEKERKVTGSPQQFHRPRPKHGTIGISSVMAEGEQ